MFSQIKVEMEILISTIEKHLDIVDDLRVNEVNPNLFNEYSGRTIGLYQALNEIRTTNDAISEHIKEILQNTTDGNYMEKLNLLEEENCVLQEKIYLLQKDLEQYKSQSLKTENMSRILKENLTEEDRKEIEEKAKKRCQEIEDIYIEPDDETE